MVCCEKISSHFVIMMKGRFWPSVTKFVLFWDLDYIGDECKKQKGEVSEHENLLVLWEIGKVEGKGDWSC